MNVALITGANSGIGLELTKILIKNNWNVIALIRSSFPEDYEIDLGIKSKKIKVYNCDLSDFKLLKKSLLDIEENEEYIDVIFNNAGVMLGYRANSPQNRDLHFEINTVVPYLISRHLIKLLKKGNKKLIINTSSNLLLNIKSVSLSDLESPRKYTKLFGPYAKSKLALSLWVQFCSNRFDEEGIKIFSICPGTNKTKMTGGSGLPFILKPIRHLFFPHPRNGANIIYRALQNADNIPSGSFLFKNKVRSLNFQNEKKLLSEYLEEVFINF